MFPNVPVKKHWKLHKTSLSLKEKTFTAKTKWSVDDIMSLLEILIETYFKMVDRKIYFQQDGLPIGKSNSKPLAGIYMHWFKENYVFKEVN